MLIFSIYSEKLSEVQIKEITAGTSHVLALDMNENIYSWGSNNNGALGMGRNYSSAFPMRIPLAQQISGILKIKAGPDTSLILLKSGELYGCGKNNFNKLGFGKNIENVEAFVSAISVKILYVLNIIIIYRKS